MFKVNSQVMEVTSESNVVNIADARKAKAKARVQRVYEVPKGGNPHILRALEAFLNTNERRKRFRNYFVDGDRLVYRIAVSKGASVEVRENVIAQKFHAHGETVIVGNSSVLGLIGRTTAYGNEHLNRQETEVQGILSALVPMIPFSVFEQAELDLSKLKMICRGPEETVIRKRATGEYDKNDKAIIVDETVHFTGASLFKVDGETFLFDIDRRELKHKIFNPFLVKMPKGFKGKTIAEAYDALKPQAVKDAEAAGRKVLRQGEWFFIPVNSDTETKLNLIEATAGLVKPLTLRAGNNRPNNARGIQMHNGVAIADERDNIFDDGWSERREKQANESQYFVKGKVTHSGREHADLILKGWYEAVPNTAIESFTITGDID